MNKSFKFVAFATVVTLLLNMLCFTTFAKGDDSTNYEQISTILRVVGILNDKNDKTEPSENVTRAEFAALISPLANIDAASADVTKQIFNDVPPEHWAAAYINSVVAAGIISGYGDGNFAPNDYISYDQIAKTMVSLLGYDVEADNLGGYPVGYLRIANELKLLKNTNISEEHYVSKNDVLQIIYNSLNVEVLQQVGFGAKESYKTVKGETLLFMRLNIINSKGILGITHKNNVIGTTGRAAKDSVIIKNVAYDIGDTNAEDYLGCEVDFYAKVDNKKETKTLLYINSTSKNTIIDIASDDISSATTIEKMVYVVNNKEVSEKISKSTVVIFNGGEILDLKDEDLRPLSGSVKMIDNNNDGEFDVIWVTSYQDYVVSSVDLEKNILFDLYGRPSIKLDSTVKYDITFNGKSIRFDELAPWDVLSIAADKEKTVNGNKVIDTENATQYSIIATNKTAIGTVNSASKDIITIENKEYKVSKQYIAELEKESPSENAIEIEVGVKGIFYLDSAGKIIAVDLSQKDGVRYGFMVKFAKTSTMTGETQFKIFSQDGKMEILKAAEKVEIDGKRIVREKIEKELEGLKDVDNEAEAVRIAKKPVRFGLNKAGEVNYLDTTRPNIEKETVSDDGTVVQKLERNDFRETSNVQSRGYRFESKSFNGTDYFFMDDSSVIFSVPTADNLDSDRDYDIIKPLFFANEKSYKTSSYAMGNRYLADMMVMVQESGSEVINDDAAIVTAQLVERVTTVLDPDGVPITKLYVRKGANRLELFCEKPELVKDVEAGDIIRYNANGKNFITVLEKEYDASEQTTLPANPSYTAQKAFICAYAQEKQGKILVVNTGTDFENPKKEDLRAFNMAVSITILTFDKKTKEVSTGSLNEIKDYKNFGNEHSLVFVHQRYSQILSVVVYK